MPIIERQQVNPPLSVCKSFYSNNIRKNVVEGYKIENKSTIYKALDQRPT